MSPTLPPVLSQQPFPGFCPVGGLLRIPSRSACKQTQQPLLRRKRSSRHVAASLIQSAHDTAILVDDDVAFVLSHFEARHLLSLQRHAAMDAKTVSGPFMVNLGLTQLDELVVHADGIALPASAEPLATWSELQRMCKKKRGGAFEVFSDGRTEPQRIAASNEASGATASLLPVAEHAPPTAVLCGFTMHRVANTHPGLDTAAKLAAVGRVRGDVLDICTGLGYTALAAADVHDVRLVTTVEIEPAMREMQRRNPWSRRLLTHEKVRVVEADAAALVETLAEQTFDVVLHDPPARVLGGALYSQKFYEQLWRVCRRGATVFHYVGDPQSHESGRLYRGIVERLAQAGFADMNECADAFGVLARRR